MMDAGLILVLLAVVVAGGFIGWAVIRWARQVDWTAYN